MVATCDDGTPRIVSGRVFPSREAAWAAVVALDPLAGEEFQRRYLPPRPAAPWWNEPQAGPVHRWVLVPAHVEASSEADMRRQTPQLSDAPGGA